MLPRERIGNRFELKAEVAKGGMGTVYKALDHQTKQQVAVKILRSAEVGSTTRFEREAAVLALLDHPGIVKYIAHGIEPGGLHYLAMEWVEGETVLGRMEGIGLDASETMSMAFRVAEALGAAHKHGVVHRDIKPSNLMFAGGRIDQLKVVDFGIARRTTEIKGLTQTGVMVGTMGYMSPEQARATRSILLDARSDIFALGCVLYECLTGMTPFSGDNLMAVRAKILLVEPMTVRAFVPEIPAALENLLVRMMAKDPTDRPPDGTALAAEIAQLPPIPPNPRKTFGSSAPMLANPTVMDERPTEEVACVVLVSPYVDDDDDVDVAPTMPKDSAFLEEQSKQVANIVAPYGGRMHQLVDGSLIVTVVGEGTVTERVERAARCALAVQAKIQVGQIVVTTEPDPAMTHVLDRLIDRGVRVLDKATINTNFESLDAIGATEAKIWLDEASAKLLGRGFEVRPSSGGHELLRERKAG